MFLTKLSQDSLSKILDSTSPALDPIHPFFYTSKEAFRYSGHALPYIT